MAMDGRSHDDSRPFRQRLDDVLRTRDHEAVREFLVTAGQWDEDASGDTEAAMWMMIAGSPALTALHAEAEGWLRAHGHAVEADLIMGGRKRPGPGQQGGASRHRDSRQGGGPHGSQGGSRANRHPPHRPGQNPRHRSGPSQPHP
jgi:hypothetical protein